MPRYISRYGVYSVIQVTLLISAIANCRISSAASFTGGNLITLRTSAASGLPSTAATAVYIDEFATAGTLVQALPVSVGIRKITPTARLIRMCIHAGPVIRLGGVHASWHLGSCRKTHKRRGGNSRGVCMLQRAGRDCECGYERQRRSGCSNSQSRWDGRSRQYSQHCVRQPAGRDLLCNRSCWGPLLHWRQRTVWPRALF